MPLISTLQQNLAVDKINGFVGILNGTTNFILSKMDSEAADYQIVLKEAQDLGFAEADPSADVEGYDTRSKMQILAQLITGNFISAKNIYLQGITQITAFDFANAQQNNKTIKLLGVFRQNNNKKDEWFLCYQ